MKKQRASRVGIAAIAVLITIMILQVSAFAETSLEAPTVDYDAGTVTIIGSLGTGNSGMRMTYTVTDADGKIVYRNQAYSGVSGTFRHSFLLSEMFTGGTYTVNIHATGQDQMLTTTFEVDRAQEVVETTEVQVTGGSQDADEVIRAHYGEELEGTYQFFSSFGVAEGTSRYAWMLSGSEDGEYHPIAGATDKTYTFSMEDISEVVAAYPNEFTEHKYYLKFAVEGNSDGSSVYAPQVLSENAIELVTIPAVSDVEISGTATVGRTLTGTYTYYDLAGRNERQSTYRWLSANSENGTYTYLASGLSYTIGSSVAGKYLKFEVTPVAADGAKGETVQSASIRVSGGSSTSGGGSGSGGGGGGGYGPTGGFTTEVSGDTPDTVVTPNTPESIPGEFADVPADHWAKSIIKEVVLRGDANGVSETEFEPERSITRAEFAKLMLNTLDLEETDYTGGFSDVSADDWYAGAVQTVADQGLMEGFDGAFQPEAYITREEMAKVVYEAYIAGGGEAIADADLSFSDVSDISDWALEAVTQASALELINGNPDGSFAPAAQATRAEAVTIINRFYHILNA